MTKINEDGNLLGRFGALAVLVALGVMLNKVFCIRGTCPVSSKGKASAGAENLRDAANNATAEEIVLPCCLGKEKAQSPAGPRGAFPKAD